MALSYNLSTQRLGNVSASSLVKSAATLSNELNSYEDTVQRLTFENDPSDENFQTYTEYLQKRIGTLESSGSIVNATKALDMRQAINSAYKTNTSFNIDAISTQMLAGNATDQTKLDYLANNVLTNPIVQEDPAMYGKYMQQAYSLQQSIQYETQAQATANEVAFNANQSAIKQGYTNAVDALDSSWKVITATFRDGGTNEVQKSLEDFTKSQAPLFQSLGIKLPTGSQLTLGGVAQAVMQAKAAYYENGAVALGTSTPDGQAFIQKAQDVVSGVSTLSTPMGNLNLFEINKWATSPTNLYSTTTNANGQTTLKENAITGYKVVKGQVIPETQGKPFSAYQALSSGSQKNIQAKLKSLGFDVLGSSDGNLQVQLTNKTAQWLGTKNNDLLPGDRLTLITTDNGNGFQMLSGAGKVYGISLDNRGLAALYGANANGQWSLVQGQQGFNASTTAAHISSFPTSPAGAPLINPVQASGVNASFNPINQAPARGPRMSQRAGGGFNFINAQGAPISAATYAMQTGQSFRGLLQNMANQGDAGARQVLGFVGNDFHYDPTKIGNGNNAQMYNAMTWGAEPNAHVNGPTISGGGLTLPSGFRL